MPNGSFESLDKKPKRLGKIENATGWVSPTGVRADLFVDTKIEDISTPYNIYGKEDAKEGTNYAGIYGYSYGDKMPRSYVMTKLSAPLKKNLRYCVKYHVSLAEASKYASNNIAALIAKKMPGTSEKVSVIEDASLYHFENDYKTLTARYNWTEVCGVYTAKGGEKYIAIGNFNSNEETKSERMKKDPKIKDIKVSQIVAAYYYIDDVSIRLIDEENGEKCDCAQSGAGEVYSSMIYQKAHPVDEDMTPEEKVNMQEVYFAYGKYRISSEGEEVLNLIAGILKANPGKKLQIFGHSNVSEDELGYEKDNFEDLDNKRLGAVMKYLMDQGINESQMIPSRKRSDEPNTKEYDENDDDELKQAKDRRVTFTLK